MTIVWEVRSTSKRVIYPVLLLTKPEIEGRTGFQSLYGYIPEVADKIRQQQGTYDLDGLPLYSDTLFIDFDNADAAAWRCAEDLASYSYTMWDTGGRGHHIVVDIEPMLGPDVPLIQKAWVKSNFPQSDYNIYKTSGVIRLPGTYHTKHPGQFKRLVKTNVGEKLKITAPVLQPRKFLSQLPTCTEAEYVKLKTEILDHLLYKVIHEGTAGRNNHAYKIACQCRDLGKGFEDALRLVETWNETCSIPPQRPQELLSTVRSAYRTRKEA